MPKFKVPATMITDLYIIINAPDADEAFRIAREDFDGGDFKEDGEQSGDWEVQEPVEYDGDEIAANAMFEVQTYTLCDGWTNTWRVEADEGDERADDDGMIPDTFESEAKAQEALEEFFTDHFAAYKDDGIEFDEDDERSQYRIVQI